MLRIVIGSLIVMLSAMGCSTLLYYPTSQDYYHRSDLPYATEEITFPDDQGNTIHSWYFHAKNPKAKILFFHGNAQNLSAHFSMLSWIVEHGYDLMIFDYPGYGRSTGSPTPKSTVLSGVAALKKIETLKPELPLFLYGQSLGGQIMQKSANVYPPKNYRAVFIEASFSSYRSVARSSVSKNWLTWPLQPIAWLIMSDEWAGDISTLSPTPVYIMHGDLDNVVDIEQGKILFEKAKEPKHWKTFNGARHSDTYFIKGGIYRTYLLDSLNKELNTSPIHPEPERINK